MFSNSTSKSSGELKKKRAFLKRKEKKKSQNNTTAFSKHFQHLTDKTQNKSAQKKENKNPSNLDKHQEDYSYQDTNGYLFVDEMNTALSHKDSSGKGVNQNNVKRDQLGDCYFLAAIGAIGRSNPEELKKLIKDNGDGTYDVRLYVKEHFFSWKYTPTVITVNDSFPESSAASLVYADYDDCKEIWAKLLEKAFAKYSGGYKDIAGGNPGEAMTMLTGNESKTIQIKDKSDTELMDAIENALTNKIPVTTSSKKTDTAKQELKAQSAGVYGSHAYVIQSINKSSKTLSLYNPWGIAHAGAISLSDFRKTFYRVQFGKI